MKPNQEITAKFWIALILFFSVVLSAPLTSNLVDKNIISYSNTTGIYFVCTLLFACLYVRLSLRYSELKIKQAKEAFYSTVSMQTINDYEEQINAQESRIKELKQAFEDAVVEITELRSENKALRDDEYELATYWKERALHKKHTKKEVESEWWECISNHYYPNFEFDSKYKQAKTTLNLNQNLICLIKDNGKSDIVEKKYFKPVK